MLILPAIDILDGRCVRLTRGDFRTPTVYSDSPAETARSFMEQGFSFLHVVDLDGAREGTVRNFAALQSVLAIKGLTIQVGGGIRTADDVKKLLSLGVRKIVTGSVAVKDPESVLRWVREFGSNHFTIALDVRGETVATDGWTSHDRQSLHDLIACYLEAGVPSILCTDIERDGMLTGPNVSLYRGLLKDLPGIELIASGGISSLEDIRVLQAAGVAAAVVGKALYEGAIRPWDLPDLTR